ncbi:class I SAM-dependent methyltransferase [Roseateles depolymerans]|uniref:Putative methyltransferase n=1 Tax=Roseateles depolymerans TaxID=76731 RepID=A0A0U3MN75_9BURK|nr:SAM-dependent methyltransferase [Roseateles depolymerans]ALV05802.1 Putative methyltransferase [Roseateles depolymerans]REG12926.1 methyltransferase family protein [Roseateles depolymerans]
MFSSLVPPPPGSPAAPDERERFVRLLRTAVAERRLERLLLSKYEGDDDIERLTIRLIELRGEPTLTFLWRHATKDITRNHAVEDGVNEIQRLLGASFAQANLDTATQQVQLRFSRKGKPLLHVARKVADAGRAGGEEAGHDRQKPRALSLDSPFWRELGVTHEVKGRVDLVPAMARKWKQINKFIEIFAAAVRHAGLADPGTRVRLADFGSGKGYLTFAMHDYLQGLGLSPDVQGVELRPDMVRVGNEAVARHGLQGLRFEQGDVRAREDMRLEVMVALHACDIATDYAMHVGLRSGARIIMCAPCCHKEVRPQMRTPAALRPLLQHGIHLGQEAEMVTDSVRALLLELMGYDTQVIEFIALEHTSKNKMVLAVKRPQGVSTARRAELVQQLQDIKQFYGLRQQTLETLLIQDGHLATA